MTLEKAIEILTDILRFVKSGDPPDEHDALKLGIEALQEKLEREKRGTP
ncbi:unnamed protein product [marine sediment metagenome]|uniref:Uncharacterized protein n=1 Tax=marine sediment metagenome TaxID=412755 RepID=X1JSG9_9ZZZZ